MEEAAVEVRGLEKSFGSRPVLEGLNLVVERGEILVILGASGSGKSTLLRCIVGLEAPDEGTLRLLGVDMQRAPRQEINRLRRRIGMAFQGGALFGSMTLFENIELPLREFTRLSPSTRDIVVRIKLTLVGLDGSGDLYPSELSGGMKKRASLARAMALDPELLFFDEPSSGLDPITAAGLDRLLLQLKAVFGVTMLVVTHELESAFTIADRIALIHEGRFAAIGTPDEIRSSDDPFVRRFVQRRPSEDIAAAARRVG